MKKSNSPPDLSKIILSRMKTASSKYKRAIQGFQLVTAMVAIAYSLFGLGGTSAILRWSDLPGLRRAGRLLGSLLVAHRADGPGDRCYWHFIFADDEGMVSDRSTIIDLELVRDKAARALRNLKLSGFIATHLHPLMNHPGGGAGRSFLLQCHGIIWTDDAFDPKEVEAALNSSRSWTNTLGGKPVVIKLIGMTDDDLRRVAAYAMNPTYCAKNLMASNKKPGKKLLMDTTKGFRPEFALRSLEVMSQIALVDTFTGVNDRGGGIAAALRTQLNAWHANRVKRASFVLAADFDVWRWWLELRREHGSKRFEPVRVVSGSIVPRPVKPKVVQPRKPQVTSETASTVMRKKRDVNWRTKLNARKKAFHMRQGRKVRRMPRGKRKPSPQRK